MLPASSCDMETWALRRAKRHYTEHFLCHAGNTQQGPGAFVLMSEVVAVNRV